MTGFNAFRQGSRGLFGDQRFRLTQWLTAGLIAAGLALSMIGEPVQAQRREEIRDTQNRLIGTIVRQSNGVLEARDPSNQVVGTYNPQTDQTRVPSNRVVSRGNILSALLVCPQYIQAETRGQPCLGLGRQEQSGSD